MDARKTIERAKQMLQDQHTCTSQYGGNIGCSGCDMVADLRSLLDVDREAVAKRLHVAHGGGEDAWERETDETRNQYRAMADAVLPQPTLDQAVDVVEDHFDAARGELARGETQSLEEVMAEPASAQVKAVFDKALKDTKEIRDSEVLGEKASVCPRCGRDSWFCICGVTRTTPTVSDISAEDEIALPTLHSLKHKRVRLEGGEMVEITNEWLRELLARIFVSGSDYDYGTAYPDDAGLLPFARQFATELLSARERIAELEGALAAQKRDADGLAIQVGEAQSEILNLYAENKVLAEALLAARPQVDRCSSANCALDGHKQCAFGLVQAAASLLEARKVGGK